MYRLTLRHVLIANAIVLFLLILLFGLFVDAQTVYLDATNRAHYRHNGAVLLNDLTVTPGVVRTSDDGNVCHTSTKAYRHTTAQMKAQVYTWYGAVKKPGVCCEADHLLPLELGGADDVKNLWPQPYEPRPGAHEKDQLENYLHAQVCAGKMKLADAQQAIMTDWYKAYVGVFHKGIQYKRSPDFTREPELLMVN